MLLHSALWSLAASAPGLADAETTTCGVDRAWVLMDVSGLDPAFGSQIISDLRAGLAPTRIDACVAEPQEPKAPLATVKIASMTDNGLVYSVDVSDSVTRKRIGRDIDLSHVPSDGRAFALAVASEELLRASWAELALAKERLPKHSQPPPPPPKQAPPRKPAALPPAPAPREFTALGVGFGAEYYTGGQTHFGMDLFWLHALSAGLRLGVTAGVRRGLSVEAASGSIDSRAVNLELSLRPTLVSSSSWSLDALVAIRGAEVWFIPEPIAGAEGSETNSQAIFGRGGLALTLGHAGSIRSVSSLGAGAPLRSFSVSDGGEVVTGVSGAELFATSGVVLEF